MRIFDESKLEYSNFAAKRIKLKRIKFVTKICLFIYKDREALIRL